MVAVDGSEWWLENSGVMVEVEEDHEEDRQQKEKVQPQFSKGLMYENWEDSCLAKFSEFLGFSTMGFEKEILGLLRKRWLGSKMKRRRG